MLHCQDLGDFDRFEGQNEIGIVGKQSKTYTPWRDRDSRASGVLKPSGFKRKRAPRGPFTDAERKNPAELPRSLPGS